MMFKKTALAAALLFAAAGAQAGSFVELPTSPVITSCSASVPGIRVCGRTNQATDPLLIDSGDVTGDDGEGNSFYGPPAGLTLLAMRETDVELEGEEVGEFFDYVYRDTADGKLVFGSRLVLTAAGAEVNDIFRSGFTGYSAAAAWAFTYDLDLRLYSAARTDVGLKEGADVFDADVIDMRSDINIDEGNATTGLFLIKTDAPNYQLLADAATVFQAGEEVGFEPERFSFAAFAPAPVPEPSTYALMFGGLGLIAAAARRRSKR